MCSAKLLGAAESSAPVSTKILHGRFEGLSCSPVPKLLLPVPKLLLPVPKLLLLWPKLLFLLLCSSFCCELRSAVLS